MLFLYFDYPLHQLYHSSSFYRESPNLMVIYGEDVRHLVDGDREMEAFLAGFDSHEAALKTICINFMSS